MLGHAAADAAAEADDETVEPVDPAGLLSRRTSQLPVGPGDPR